MGWLLIRGLLREQGHWGSFVEKMKLQFQSEKILTLDIPGNGVRNSLPSPTKISTMVDDLRGQLRSLSWDEPLNLLGVSMGGMMVADWIYSFPKEVNKAVLINTSMRSESRVFERLRPGALLRLSPGLISNPIIKEKIILDLVSNSESAKSASLHEWQHISETRPVTKLNGLRQLYAASRFELPPSKPDVPVLLLASAKDRLVSVNCSRQLAKSWGTSLCINRSGGHDLTLDQPDWVLDKMSAWINE